MTEHPHARPGLAQWLILLIMAAWLAIVPLVVTASLSALVGSPPDLLVQLGLVAPGDPALLAGTLGLLATLLTLGLNLLAFLPLYITTRRPGREFLRTTALLLIAIALVQALNALAGLAADLLPDSDLIRQTREPAFSAILRLLLVLPLLLLGLGAVEAHRQNDSLIQAWRRVGLRLWLRPSAMWLALAAGAVLVWPWMLAGSLGSPGTTAANAVQALPAALNQEILFRGFAFAWLWRATRSRSGGAVGSLILFVAAQGGTVLPSGDWGALPRFLAVLPLGLLTTELTIRAGGSIWPAIALHFLYAWFPLAFVDPRSQEQVLHWLAKTWSVLAAVGIATLLWFARTVRKALRDGAAPQPSRAGPVATAVLACLGWAFVALLYLIAGVPGFHHDGFLIFLEEQADLGPAALMDNPAGRRAWAYDTLTETAQRSQAPLRATLDRQGVEYRPHYLINAIEVLERPGLRRRFAREPGVASVLFQPGMRRYPNSFDLPALDSGESRGVEWNVLQVGADRVWELGHTGQGVVVGGADTGVAWDHPALKEAYLGSDTNGAGTADHNYHWYDSWDGRAQPVDDSGHGTHTTGTVVGQDGENRVGIAPGARWIACRNMRHGIGNPGSYLGCMEFLLAPFPLDGDPLWDGDPERGAHLVNNSWGCPRREGCLPDTLRTAVENLRAAGQMMVVSAGNEGPTCGTVEHPPATYDAVFSVGAVDAADRATGLSSRGPVIVDGSGRSEPDLVAPGLDIRSSVPGGYASLPGTSMAGPHVAGAVALLWSAEPALIGDIEGTESHLARTAQQLTVDAACPSGPEDDPGTVCGCAGEHPDSVPNQVYGWGQLDVGAAVQALLGGP